MSGAKHKLSIRQWNTQAERVEKGPVFTAMLNPAKYSRVRNVEYTQDKALADGTLPEKKFKCVSADTLELDELVLDGTGIIDAPEASQSLDVDGQVALLRRVLYNTGNDKKVKLAVVQVLWGSMAFQGRVASMTVNYTLFSSAGTPLRARVKLTFTAYENSTAQLAAGAGAPQTRQIRLVGGDSLPLLCFNAYNDPSLHLAVALFNKLTTIRKLQPGLKIKLPVFD